ncbi:MAG: hypothetical protein NWQ45_01735, partial [Congregibacter sp.]|nr:hypothetical protein [Congregibacter sp.]
MRTAVYSGLFSIYLLLTPSVLAQAGYAAMAVPSAPPAREGFSSERLQRINERMNEAVEDGIMVGG